MFHNEIMDFVEYIQPTEQENALRKQVISRITNIIQKTYPEAKTKVFGSCATGLNLPTSDIDLLCYYPEMKDRSG